MSSITPHIKICGLRDTSTIAAMDGLDITEIGLVFAPSKRQVSVEEGIELTTSIKQLVCRDGKPPRAAGVFVNMPLEDMTELLHTVELDIIQLHGTESLDYYAALHARLKGQVLWKVISIAADVQKIELSQLIAELEPFMPYVERILIDAPGGGTGKTFNWEAINAYQQAANYFNKPLLIAGGLYAGNVTELLQHYDVDGIDVSSGVETDGKKDIAKIKEFVRKVIDA